MEDIPASVPSGDETSQEAKQAGEARGRWPWTEPAVWTERMLAALEKGVKGGKWFSLMDKVYSYRNLWSAFQKVAANKGAAGVDHVTIEMFERDVRTNLRQLSEELREGTYRPHAVKRVWIPKPGGKELRPLGIPTVRDRVVQAALRNVLEPIFERDFAEHSYGFRPGRGCKDALRRVDELLKAGYTRVVDADLKAYFDTISHRRLQKLLSEKVSDGRVLRLLEIFLEQGILDGQEETIPEKGSPQGSVISPLLSNVYLNPLDHWMTERGYEMVRYADDFVILCRSREEAEAALEAIKEWTAQAELVLHPTKTRIVSERKDGVDFLGYRFRRGRRWPRDKSIQKLRATLRSKTKRSNGESLKAIIANVNKTLKGWFEYFKHSDRVTFPKQDKWVRVRLRSILRKRYGGKGHGRGRDHWYYPIAFFTKQGLYSMTIAHALARQSLTR